MLKKISNRVGIEYKLVSNYKGGTYKGPCPGCGGDDRFTIQPNNLDGTYICNKCKKQGDLIQFFRDFFDMSYLQACHEVGQEPEIKKRKNPAIDSAINKKWEPRKTEQPATAWKEAAHKIAVNAYREIMSPAGKQARIFLKSRGIGIEYIKKFRIGYNPAEYHVKKTEFDPDTDESEQVWIPKGIIIPNVITDELEKEFINRIRIRQDEPNGKDRYILVTGSNTDYMRSICDHETDKNIIVESELDMITVRAAGIENINIFAIGNSTTRPDEETHGYLAGSKNNIFSLDNDEAGANESLWFTGQYTGIIHTTDPEKDPGEYARSGRSVAEWVRSGLEKLKNRCDGIKFNGKKLDFMGYGIREDRGAGESEQNGYIFEPKELEAFNSKVIREDVSTHRNKKSDTIKKFNSTIKKVNTTIKKFNSQTCKHGEPCMFNINGDCIKSEDKTAIKKLYSCPLYLWKSYFHDDNANVETVVFMAGYYKRK